MHRISVALIAVTAILAVCVSAHSPRFRSFHQAKELHQTLGSLPQTSHGALHRAVAMLERYEAAGISPFSAGGSFSSSSSSSPFRTLFSGAEHRFGGNGQGSGNGYVILPVLPTGDPITNPNADDIRYSFPSPSFRFKQFYGMDLGSYGDIVAMCGDYFGPDSPDEIICDGANDAELKARFITQFNRLYTLSGTSDNENFIAAIHGVFDTEINAINANTSIPPAQVYDSLGTDRFSNVYFLLNKVAILALFNNDHFGDVNCATRAYRGAHMSAIEQAQAAALFLNNNTFTFSSAPIEQRQNALANARKALEKAYMMNAFGDHFLTDMFAAGHGRTPRRELLQTCASDFSINGYHMGIITGGIAARWQHDEDNRNGLMVRNGRGDVWKSYGDDNFFDIRNAANAAMLQEAVNISRSEVYAAFNGAGYSQAALSLIPSLNFGAGDQYKSNNTCALYRRNPITNVTQMRSPAGRVRPNIWYTDRGLPLPNGGDPNAVDCNYFDMSEDDCPDLIKVALQEIGKLIGGDFDKWLNGVLEGVHLTYSPSQQAYVSAFEIPEPSAAYSLAPSALIVALATVFAVFVHSSSVF